MRTHQLNSTGIAYSYDQLDELRKSDDHLLLVAGLEDKYGTYGKIGLALVETGADCWTLRMMLMSCRVMTRGVGTILMSHILMRAKQAEKRLLAEFRETSRNQVMKVTYRFAGFKEIERNGDTAILENRLENIQPFPTYVEIDVRS